MNSIPRNQNSERQLQRLAAQRQLYTSAKTVFGWQLIICGPVAVVLAVSVAIHPSLKAFAALWGILVAICDVTWITPWQKKMRSSAAGIQELFDCDVLELPWEDIKAGKRPDPELIKEQAEKYRKQASSMPPITDWYAKEVGSLPLHIARLICQRSNCWWDAKQRRRYAATVIFLVILAFLSVFFLAMGNGLTLEDFVLKVVAPLSPAFLLGYRQFTEQMEAASRLDKLKDHAERIWKEALEGRPDAEITIKSRALQDEIFENRRRSPFVFDMLFKHLRHDFELQMNHAASEYIDEAKQKFNGSKPLNLNSV